ncbi:hypothetical protein [Kiloniella sp. EL199]|uniref:hypothetical protein n=1 Tax=Kiloniella sp. EL199 TaxID=2107581 RepID=UPI000EA12A89|nr:hypothetical protein [Kiloniella sp. EL199]
MKKSFLIISLILMSFSLSSQAYSSDVSIPKNHKGQAINLAALAKDAAWRQKISKKWKASQAKEAARKNKYIKARPVTLENTQEAAFYDRQDALAHYN